MKAISNVLLASVACATLLAGCVTSGQGQFAVGPTRVNVAGPMAPPPVVVEEAYQPLPTDIYVAVAVDRDIFVSGGNTYIWVRGPDGVRHRHFYAHGDHRADIFHRREELHRVMARHEGHLPDHPIGAHPQMERAQMEHPGGGPAPAMASHGQPKPGGAPGAAPGRTPAAHAAAPAKPAPSARAAWKDPNKS